MTQSDKKEEKNKETQKAEPTSEKEKKLNRKVADKLKFYGVVTVLSLLCAGFIWFIFKPDTTETVEGTAGINTTIPDAIAPETMADKQKAYELERMKKRRQEKVRTLQDMAGDYLIPDTSDGLKPEKAAPEQDAIRESRQQQQQISRQIASFYQEPKESPRVDELERQGKELNEKLRGIYSEIMSSPSMVEYNTAKADLDTMMNEVNTIISKCVDGEDPDTCDVHSGCTGSCASCGGCH